jgi:hypothetical protein
MAIYRLIANGSFGPDEIEAMSDAYEGALIDLHLTNRDDPISELIAKFRCRRARSRTNKRARN